MVNEYPNSSSYPSTIPKTIPETLVEDPGKSVARTESETLVSVLQEGVTATISQQRMSRRRRADSRTNRDDRRHRLRRNRTSGSTYRPNYNALPERPPEYRECPERKWETEPAILESYQQYSTSTNTYDRPYNPGYPHDDHTWGRKPLYEFK